MACVKIAARRAAKQSDLLRTFSKAEAKQKLETRRNRGSGGIRILSNSVVAIAFCVLEIFFSISSVSSFPPCFKVFLIERQYNICVLKVRDYQPQDFPRLLEIDQSCFVEGIAYSKEELRYFLGMPTAISLVGLQDEEIMGFIIADRFRPRRASRSVGKIITIDVAPQAQHSGMGTLLMSSAEAELKQCWLRLCLS